MYFNTLIRDIAFIIAWSVNISGNNLFSLERSGDLEFDELVDVELLVVVSELLLHDDSLDVLLLVDELVDAPEVSVLTKSSLSEIPSDVSANF